MNRRVLLWLLAVGLLVAVRPGPAQSSNLIPFERDHLKCYLIKDNAPSATYKLGLENQFGREGCVLTVPARFLCAETAKVVVTPQPPGGGPGGVRAGHFLCYHVTCPGTKNPPNIKVHDQFGQREIQFNPARLLCAPVNKLVCNDGDVDPGEDCDPPGSPTCPDAAGVVGLPCGPDCRCPPPCGLPTAPECSGACPEGTVCRAVTSGDHFNGMLYDPPPVEPLCKCVQVVGDSR